MAEPIDRVMVRRTALLARCQKTREERARTTALAAARKQERACLAWQGAEESLRHHAQRSAAGLRAEWDRVAMAVVTPPILDAVRLKEARAHEQSLALTDAVAAAAATHESAKGEQADAQLLLAAASRLCRKREALAERAVAGQQRATAMREELTIEDEAPGRGGDAP